MASVTEVLIRTKELTQENWCAYRNGRPTKRVGKGDSCLLQNLVKAELELNGHTGSRKNGRDNSTEAETILREVAGGKLVSVYNDSNEHGAVLALLDNAIKVSSKQEKNPKKD